MHGLEKDTRVCCWWGRGGWRGMNRKLGQCYHAETDPMGFHTHAYPNTDAPNLFRRCHTQVAGSG